VYRGSTPKNIKGSGCTLDEYEATKLVYICSERDLDTLFKRFQKDDIVVQDEDETQIIDSLDILQSLFERNASLVTYTMLVQENGGVQTHSFQVGGYKQNKSYSRPKLCNGQRREGRDCKRREGRV
jgi:hypothetical protein